MRKKERMKGKPEIGMDGEQRSATRSPTRRGAALFIDNDYMWRTSKNLGEEYDFALLRDRAEKKFEPLRFARAYGDFYMVSKSLCRDFEAAGITMVAASRIAIGWPVFADIRLKSKNKRPLYSIGGSLLGALEQKRYKCPNCDHMLPCNPITDWCLYLDALRCETEPTPPRTYLIATGDGDFEQLCSALSDLGADVIITGFKENVNTRLKESDRLHFINYREFVGNKAKSRKPSAIDRKYHLSSKRKKI